MVIAEAFASGLPVIASRVGALAEIVKEGETGLLITPGSVDELADRIEWASTHPDEMARMGRNARLAYEERFTPAHNYKELLAIYREAIAHPCSDRAVLSSHHR